MSDIFISYKREEQDKARQLATALMKEGWTVWWDRNLQGGQRIEDVIQHALSNARCVVSILSTQALQSDYVMNETRYALRRKKLIPVVIDYVELPFDLEGVHTPKLIGWNGNEASADYKDLLEDIVAVLGVSSMRKDGNRSQLVESQVESGSVKQAMETGVQVGGWVKKDSTNTDRTYQAGATGKQQYANGAEEVAPETASERATVATGSHPIQKDIVGVIKFLYPMLLLTVILLSVIYFFYTSPVSVPDKDLQVERQAKIIGLHKEATRLLSEKSIIAADDVLSKMRTLSHNHPAISDIEQKLLIAKSQQQDEAKKRIEQQQDEGQTTDQEETIITLHEKAEKAERYQNITTPVGDNAVYFYRKILRKDPENKSAIAKLDHFYEEYVRLATISLKEGDWENLDINIRKAAEIHKNHAQLSKLQSGLEDLVLISGISAPIPEMVEIPEGELLMGSNQTNDDSQRNERPQHPVTIGMFYMSKYEVTYEEYDYFALITGRKYPHDDGNGRGRRPVSRVIWEDAVAYAEWLSDQTGINYRLPTEAEWEYASRSGTATKYWWGDEAQQNRKIWANCNGCGSQWDNQYSTQVGSFEPNKFDLYDTAGNVWEWTADCWHDNYENAPTTGVVWGEQNSGNCYAHVLKGGSYRDKPISIRSATRKKESSTYAPFIGFRIARDAN
ncbi:MAG: SUMF1/EgtB/PvdO family nonheme iron enzyme [Candidatus Thiodiazotropha endolucinida]